MAARWMVVVGLACAGCRAEGVRVLPAAGDAQTAGDARAPGEAQTQADAAVPAHADAEPPVRASYDFHVHAFVEGSVVREVSRFRIPAATFEVPGAPDEKWRGYRWVVPTESLVAFEDRTVREARVAALDASGPARVIERLVERRAFTTVGAGPASRDEDFGRYPREIEATRGAGGWERRLLPGSRPWDHEEAEALASRSHPFDWHWYPDGPIAEGSEITLPRDAFGISEGCETDAKAVFEEVVACGAGDRCARLRVSGSVHIRALQNAGETTLTISGTILHSLTTALATQVALSGEATIIEADRDERGAPTATLLRGAYTITSSAALAD